MVEKLPVVIENTPEPPTRRVTYPYPTKGDLESVMAQLRDILMAGKVYRVILTQDRPIEVDLYHEASPSPDTGPLLLSEIVRSIELVNVSGHSTSAVSCIGEVLKEISDAGLYGCFIVARSREVFSVWATGRRDPPERFMGLSIHAAPELPDDVAIICAASTPSAIPLDVVLGYKINLDRFEPVVRQI